jgi:hypothetical protein
MKINISEEQYQKIVESFRNEFDPIAEFIRKTLKDVYTKIPGKWGKLPNPDGNCDTNEGVINIYEHQPGIDRWSVLNRFDTNKKVRNRLRELFTEQNPGTELSNTNFMEWIGLNKEDLFHGKYTDELVLLNKSTIDSGNRNEELAVKILREKWGDNAIINRFCSGDIRDTKSGMDISVEVNGKKFYVQVKPFKKITSFVDRDGDTFFEVNAYFDPKKYSERNVQVILFVDSQTGDYVAFENKRNRILAKSASVVNFYEPFLMSNITFTSQIKKYLRKDLGDELFDMGSRRLQNLIFRKDEIEKLIELERQKLSNKNPNN